MKTFTLQTFLFMVNSFVSEIIIDQTATEIGASEIYFKDLLKDFQTQQPYIFAYTFSESFSILTQSEKEYLLYLAVVVWKSISTVQPNLTIISEREIGEIEERNWGVYEDSKGKTFRNKLDVFFQGYVQEDLLAFVEDALTIDEEDEVQPITKEGRVPLFIALRSIIDSLTTP